MNGLKYLYLRYEQMLFELSTEIPIQTDQDFLDWNDYLKLTQTRYNQLIAESWFSIFLIWEKTVTEPNWNCLGLLCG